MQIENGSTVARWVAFSLMFLLFTSCSVNQIISQVDWKNGARLGWVVRFYGPDLALTERPQCLAAMSNEELATRHIVGVNYKKGRQLLHAVAILPVGLTAHIDDQVELWPEDCTQGKIARIVRIFPSSS